MIKVCELCGTEYESDAQYCNLCRRESLIAVETPPEPKGPAAPLTTDPITLGLVATVWLLGLGYLLAEVRPRSWAVLVLVWGALTLISTALCLTMKNARMAAIFSAIGLVFVAIYGALQL